MPRVIVPLAEDEYEALLLVSQVEKRDPRDQMAFWARQRMEQGGLLLPGLSGGLAARPASAGSSSCVPPS